MRKVPKNMIITAATIPPINWPEEEVLGRL